MDSGWWVGGFIGSGRWFQAGVRWVMDKTELKVIDK